MKFVVLPLARHLPKQRFTLAEIEAMPQRGLTRQLPDGFSLTNDWEGRLIVLFSKMNCASRPVIRVPARRTPVGKYER